MPSPSTIELKINTTADTAGLEQTTAGVRKLEEATRTGTVTASAAVRGQEALDGATKKTQTTTANTGQTMLTFGRIVQDGVAAGLPGMVNNFEGLAMALGLGSGVAGAVTVLAVGMQVLLPLLEAGEDAAAKAAEASESLATKSRNAALEAERGAKQAHATAAAHDALEASIKRASNAYDEQVRAAKAATAARMEEIRLREIEGDSKAELDMAKVEEALQTGQITPEEAERKKSQIGRAAARRKFEADQEAKAVKESEQIAAANAAKAKAAALENAAKKITGSTDGLLTDKDRKAAEERAKQAADEAAAERGKLTTAEGRFKDESEAFFGFSPEEYNARRREVEMRKKRTEEANRKSREARAILDKDREAQNASGFTSADDAADAAEKLREQAAEEARKAEEFSGAAARSEKGRKREADAFRTREQAAAIREKAAAAKRAADAAANDKKDADRSREGAMNEAGQSANALAGMGRGAGMNQDALTKMERLANQVAGGDNSEQVLTALEGMIKAFAKSAAGNSKMAEKIARMEKEMEEANAAITTLRSGH